MSLSAKVIWSVIFKYQTILILLEYLGAEHRSIGYNFGNVKVFFKPIQNKQIYIFLWKHHKVEPDENVFD